jgi:hypothetical protein
VPLVLVLKRSGESSISRSGLNALRSSSRKRDGAHPRVRLTMVSRRRALVSRTYSPAVELQPTNSIREVEGYPVELSGVTVLELVIVPDISRGSARASLKSLRVS